MRWMDRSLIELSVAHRSGMPIRSFVVWLLGWLAAWLARNGLAFVGLQTDWLPALLIVRITGYLSRLLLRWLTFWPAGCVAGWLPTCSLLDWLTGLLKFVRKVHLLAQERLRC